MGQPNTDGTVGNKKMQYDQKVAERCLGTFPCSAQVTALVHVSPAALHAGRPRHAYGSCSAWLVVLS